MGQKTLWDLTPQHLSNKGEIIQEALSRKALQKSQSPVALPNEYWLRHHTDILLMHEQTGMHFNICSRRSKHTTFSGKNIIQLMHSFEANNGLCQPQKVMSTEVKLWTGIPAQVYLQF